MSTLDAPFWLRWAREYNEGTYGKTDHLNSYPNNTETFKELSVPKKFLDSSPIYLSSLSKSENRKIKYRDIPLLSFLIAHLAPFFNYNYLLTGTLLIPTFASLFILPLGIYFFRIGIPVSGLLGGLIGTFASGYYVRSSIGRIDTDMLNLFFPSLVALMIIQASLAKSERKVLLFSIAIGLIMFLFQWWYMKSGFILVYFSLLVLCLFIHQFRFRTILLSALFFVLSVNPLFFMNGLSNIDSFVRQYFPIKVVDTSSVILSKTIPATFPNTMTTISEVDHVEMDEVFRRIISEQMIDWVGFFALFCLAVLRWRVLLPLLPMLLLGFLSFNSSNRFIMYLAPFIGIGLGWLLQIGTEALFLLFTKNISPREDKEVKGRSNKIKLERIKSNESILVKIISWISMDKYENGFNTKLEESYDEPLRNKGSELKKVNLALRIKGTKNANVDWVNWGRQIALYGGMGFFFWLISGQTAMSYVPGPSIHPRVYMTFQEVKKLVPQDSALLTWWDYGYAIKYETELAVFHDGGSQSTPLTYFVARSLISSDQEELYIIIKYLATEGIKGIYQNNSSPKKLLEAVNNPKKIPWDLIYLFFTADMTGKYGAISKLGSWDIENGGSKPSFFRNLACNKITNEEINCRGAKIDLKNGFINNQLALRRMIFIRDGQVVREQEFGHAQGFTLQLLVFGNNIGEVQLIDEEVFLSNYNQMFLLGRYRQDLFEETYNAFPFSRLYRFKY